jgi:phage I-like protein
VRGVNETENGTFVFDDVAAAAVMAAYEKWGVDLSIDLEHQMLAEAAPDPTARDARGWCKLELRADGSLWAVQVSWTPDGAARLSEKRQRYVSPAFEIDPKTKRVTKIVNVAITAMPATHNTPALVAASAGGPMDPKQVAAALDALISGDTEKCAELLKGIIATAAGADPDAATEDAPPPAGDGGADEATEAAAAAPAAPGAPGAAQTSEDEVKATVAAASKLLRLSGKHSIVEAVGDAETWRKSHLELETERQRLAAERATLEAAERRKGCVDLVVLGGHAPATVWADDKATAPKKYLAAMPIGDFREFVSDAIKASKSAKAKPAPGGSPPPGGESKTFVVEGKSVTLDARELAICADEKCDPQVFALIKSRRNNA